MDILEAIRWLVIMINENKRAAQSFPESNASKRAEAMETVLNALDNSISKDKIREKINELEEQIEEVRKNISNSTDEEKIYWRKEKRDLVLQKFILEELLKEE